MTTLHLIRRKLPVRRQFHPVDLMGLVHTATQAEVASGICPATPFDVGRNQPVNDWPAGLWRRYQELP